MILNKKYAFLFLSAFILYVSCTDNPVSSTISADKTKVGKMPGDLFSDIMFYSKDGKAQFYKSTGNGDLQLSKEYNGWSKDWSQIVSGEFGGDQNDDFFFYDKRNGVGEFYKSNGDGSVTLLKRYTGWSKNWSIIVPGNFCGNNYTGLFFYSASDGVGEFYKSNGDGSLTLLKRYTGWSKNWSTIVPGNFCGNNYTGLFFYSASDGVGEFYKSNGDGSLTLLKRYTGWAQRWDIIVPGQFGGSAYTDLLFYDNAEGKIYPASGEFYTSNGDGSISLLKYYSSWSGKWDIIIPGNFNGDSYTDLMFYADNKDKVYNAEAEFYNSTGDGGLTLTKSYTGWGIWEQINSGYFCP